MIEMIYFLWNTSKWNRFLTLAKIFFQQKKRFLTCFQFLSAQQLDLYMYELCKYLFYLDILYK